MILTGFVRRIAKRQLTCCAEKNTKGPIGEAQRRPSRAKPLDPALPVLFLASGGARMGTAQEFTVAGGWA